MDGFQSHSRLARMSSSRPGFFDGVRRIGFGDSIAERSAAFMPLHRSSLEMFAENSSAFFTAMLKRPEGRAPRANPPFFPALLRHRLVVLPQVILAIFIFILSWAGGITFSQVKERLHKFRDCRFPQKASQAGVYAGFRLCRARDDIFFA
jgi:hypothetical protein